MPMLRAWLALLLLAGFARAQGRAELRWRFQPGKTFYQEITIDGRQTTTAKDGQMPIRILQTLYVAWTPLQLRPDRSWVVRQQILGMSMVVHANGRQVSYDSANPAASPRELADGIEPLINAEFLFVINPQMKTIQVSGLRELFSRMGQVSPKVKQTMQGLLSEESLRQLSDQTFAVLPDRPVAPGERWLVDNRVQLGPLGSCPVQHAFSYDGTVERTDGGKLHRIRMETVYGKPEQPSGAPAPVKQFDLTGSRATGIILFDADKGRIKALEQEVSLAGKVTVESNGAVQQLDTVQEHTIRIRTSDKNPLAK